MTLFREICKPLKRFVVTAIYPEGQVDVRPMTAAERVLEWKRELPNELRSLARKQEYARRVERDKQGLSAETWREQERRRYRDNPANRARQSAKAKRWCKANPDKKKKSDRRFRIKAWRTNPEYRLKILMRTRMRMALKGKCKHARTFELIGCTPSELRSHLESQFVDGMTWENHGAGKGKWHIDHRVPIAAHDLTTIEGQKAAFHFSNTQPLWHEEDHKKSSVHEGRYWMRGKPHELCNIPSI